VLWLLVLAGSWVHDRLVTQNSAVDAAWIQVQTQLQKRSDPLSPLTYIVRFFAPQEISALSPVMDARDRVSAARTPEEATAASNELRAALARLMTVAEKYPDMTSNREFIQLQGELAAAEKELAVARGRYNDAVREYDTTVMRFPTGWFARIFGFQERSTFEAPESAREVPAARS
jgi:LemA protein